MRSFVWPVALSGLVCAGVLGIAAVRCARANSIAAARIASGSAHPALRAARRIGILRAVVVSTALALMVVAWARPVGAPVTEATVARSADVIIAVDVSLSMLATDTPPSRFERARLILRALVDRLEGDRVGLVAFSGSSGILLPLTLDTDAARLFADGLQTQSVDEPGTSLDRAVDRAIEMFETAGEGSRVLVVISDGEDVTGDPLDVARRAASRARDAGIDVATVTIGTEEGSTIPLDVLGTNALKRGPDGEPVISKARGDVLSALGGDGLALEATTGDEADRIADWVESKGSATAERRQTTHQELFQIPLIAALALLVLDYAYGSWRRS